MGRSALVVAALVAAAAAVLLGAGASKRQTVRVYSVERKEFIVAERVVKSDADWRKQLTPEQYEVARKGGTEPAFSGAYWDHHARGTYRCASCGNDLFASETKFDSGTGWPSFWDPVAKENVTLKVDTTLGMQRTEILCARCDAHLGHVFEDGPKPTGLRYCVNSAALDFAGAKKKTPKANP